MKPKGRGLIYNGRFYPYHAISDLPQEIQLANTRTVVTDAYIAYHSDLAPFSNFYTCQLQVDGQMFNSVEQALSYRKATFAGDLDKAARIKDSFKALDVKNIAKTISCKEWKQHDQKHLHELNVMKYEQDPDLLQLLMNSGDRLLLEAVSDPFWGVGGILESKSPTAGHI